MVEFINLPFEIILYIAELNHNVWYCLIQVDRQLGKYSLQHHVQEIIKRKFSKKKVVISGNKQNIYYELPNGNIHGEYLYYRLKKDKQILIGKYNYYMDLQEGIQRTWYINGKKKLEYIINDNRLHGKYTRWYDNEQIELERFFVNGLGYGSYKRWSYVGHLISNFILEADKIISVETYRFII